MDMIAAAALNEPASAVLRPMDSSSSSSKEVDNFNKPPNFDNFINHQQQQQHQPYQPQRQNSTAADGPMNNNKVRFDVGHNSPSATGAFGNVRIHQTEMQRYLQGLMQSQNNQFPSQQQQENSNFLDNSKVEMLHQMKSGLGGQLSMDDVRTVAKSSFLKGENNSGGGNNSGGDSARSQHLSRDSSAHNSAHNNSGGGGNNNPSRPSSPNSAINSSPHNSTTTNVPAGTNNNNNNARQKNDKAVEVHHDHNVIARFRTQTECARYLRATPEAVSYHCSKGGGICNGLVIQPLSSVEVTHLMDMSSNQQSQQQSQSQQSSDNPFFGLFEGAVQHRPKERPQLKPETVSILKEWLLSPDHMDNPYPNQRESEMLMERTGLDKTQLKHWFNNARKRILKPLLKNGGRKGVAVGATGPSPAERTPREGKKRGSAGSAASSANGGGGSTGRKSSMKKKRKSSHDSGGDTMAASASKVSNASHATNSSHSPSLLPNSSSLCGTIGVHSNSNHANTHEQMSLSNHLSTSQRLQNMQQFEQERQQLENERQQQLLLEEMRQVRPQFDDPFHQDQGFRRGDSNGSSSGSNNNNGGNNGSQMMSMTQYDRLMGYHNNGMNSGMSRGGGGHGGDSGGMMSYGDSMGGMMNGNNSRNSFHDNGYGGSSSMRGGGGGFQGRGNSNGGMGGGFNGCMEVNESNNPYDRFTDYPQSRMNNSSNNNSGNSNRQGFHQDRFLQEFNQDAGYSNNNNDDNDNPYGQALQFQGQDPRDLRQDPRDLHHDPPSTSHATTSITDDSARSNAVFKQQVATMAMNEASTAFKDMEDAFAHAKGVLAASRTQQHPSRRRSGSMPTENPEDDPMVVKANARAKKCQSVA
eukprot:CAMPEP_0201872278 /NCGR_PEP_ID=MMETSP0902-20130614/5027_1 /ASSEMBLY_ACC=CAM_ASM_000551 /TAXON_ID=420261 /ORGANISM="Thalassiosira antarctica, Strain CCMP982" /LENGTH=863 /DNA_ID=CAMNT_0048398511 /DNA_START=76 /DNA_END=2663 /DNA_ORIENTATION=-